MSVKRKTPTSMPADSPSTKRSRVSASEQQDDGAESSSSKSPNTAHKYPRSDPVFGQKHAFPGLDDDDSDELLYGPPEDGLQYLRMVRSEAKNLPAIFISQERLVNGNGNNLVEQETGARLGTDKAGPGGYYSDGVYVALSTATEAVVPLEPENDEGTTDPQEIYYNLLYHRFRLLRSTLKCVPTADAIVSLDDQHPISLPDDHKHARLVWRGLLRTVDPQMVQIACMDPEDVLRVLAVVTRSISDAVKSKETVRVKRLAAWAWGLLGRCREVGEMGSEEVADIRELGKRAVKILLKVREIEEQGYAAKHQQNVQVDVANVVQSVADAEEECTEGGNERLGINEIALNSVSEEDQLEAAKARLRARLASIVSDDNVVANQEAGPLNMAQNEAAESEDDAEAAELRKQTRAMLDMIISIVGEFYGQRDLLESRDLWEEGEKGWMS
ncbi:hypothetical protein CPC735_046880 [Coccidioides posadasii C735 delta SOWgp]|uniref:Uncharacterized protein n=1 Tax=Coccidioides posadasii (strain C735) TaxID=222929 RepID=C5PFJ0_COCP7|nr:hypothetical protein CPC735_046880 [Coccidioides posadasii C735 delta SOWgp]EER23318.1 hypothetical protein CPC735_046880 [Coccidioides posadasii C735 delta SOWgp]|eukprot:XP_003065463.1 hypothetical protein CPC735_046880 [Coccidioides posadasii C735 delta SOWgp]